jgi:UDP-GlcNAc:undecaprenyl-phosphate GlcNAc-1-phosphate transferase
MSEGYYLLVIGLLSAASAFFLTPALVVLGNRYKFYDPPCERSVHSRNVSRLGGIAVFAGFAVGFSLFTYLVITGRIDYASQPVTMFAFFLGATLFFLLGLLDDFFGLSARFKLVIMIVIALMVILMGVRIGSLFGYLMLPMWFAVGFSVFWVVGIVNTMNFIDGLDGLASGVGLLASIAFLIIAIVRGEWFTAFLLVCIIGSLAGFLPHNFFPAKIFLGDSGSLTIGYFLAVISIIGLYKQITLLTLAVPLMVLALPIADTAFAIARRLVRGVPITRPDRRHIHHRLLALFGRNHGDATLMMESSAHRSAVIACYIIAVVFATIAVYIGVQK